MLSDQKQRFIKNVKGPVFPVPTPFKENGEVDYPGLSRYVAFLLEQGAETIMVTVGTSRFDLLTVDEMLEVNRIVAQTVGGKGSVIVTTSTNGPTAQAQKFVQRAEKDGADGILLVFPDRYYSDDQILQYYKDVASVCSLGILVHLAAIRAGCGGIGPMVQYSPALLQRIMDIENVVGVKEESHDAGLSYQYNRTLTDRCVVIGGAGGMRDFMTKHQWGQQAYLVSVGNFIPQLEIAFYQSIISGDYQSAKEIIFRYEEPFFRIAVKSGWHIALKEAMALQGLMSRWERSPMSQLAEQDQDDIIKLLKDQVWQDYLLGRQEKNSPREI